VKVTYFQRKPRAEANFSVEFVFADLRKRLEGLVEPRVAICTFESLGVLRRIANTLEAAFRQGEVNHVTGDVNYVGLLLDGKRTIQTILDCGHLLRAKGLRRRVLQSLWVELPVKRSAHVTVISESTKAELLQYVDCSPEKISVIPVAISDRFRPVEKAFDRGAPRVLAIGTAPNKNVDRLAEALRGTGCRLDLVGRREDRYDRLLAGAGIPYTYRSGLTLAEVTRAYGECDLVAMVSTHEGFGMPILEAQATGRVVVTSNVSSMPEVAGKGACFVDPLDVASIRAGIRRVIDDEGYRARLIALGLENVKRFDPQSIAERYLDLYRRVGAMAR
jgi:glycosyltransferase involved in cell wall biosynthesis